MRLAMRVLGYTAAGAVATLVIAWGSAMAFAIDTSQPGRREVLLLKRPRNNWDHYFFIADWRCPGGRCIGSCTATTATMVGRPREVGLRDGAVPAWAKRATFRLDDVEDWYRVVEARGWPLPAMVAEGARGLDGKKGRVLSGLRVNLPWKRVGEPATRTEFTLGAVLPTRLLVPGFLGNAALIGLACFMLPRAAAVLPRAMRRRRRRQRGLCVACGYELAGLGRCPECGRHGEASSPPPTRDTRK